MRSLGSRRLGVGLFIASAFVPVFCYGQDAPAGRTAGGDVEEALRKPDLCQEYVDDRTTRVSIDNDVDVAVEIAFGGGKDEDGVENEDFIDDTGAVIVGTNKPAHSSFGIDICYAGGYRRPIQLTYCEIAIKWRDGDSDVAKMWADEGYYYEECGVTYYYDKDTKGQNVRQRKLNVRAAPRAGR